MKTSTKIFTGVVVAAAVACAVNFGVSQTKYKKYNPSALRLAEQLEVTGIRVVDIGIAPTAGVEMSQNLRNRYNYSRTENADGPRNLNVAVVELDNVRISGDTLIIENYDGGNSFVWSLFRSPELETVVIRESGVPDEVLDYRPEEPVTDSVGITVGMHP